MPRRVLATRYVTPLREGGSLPAVVEADDDGMYVMKFRGAGQGPKVLIAEWIAGELARAIGLQVPEIVLIDLDPALGRAEPDDEIRDLLKASTGLNLALDYLPGSVTFDPVAGPVPDAETASAIVWFDALVTNIDRTPKNPNLLTWHRALWLIDHGSALYAHHAPTDFTEKATAPFPAIKDHVLLPFASALREADQRLKPKVTDEVLQRICAALPDEWIEMPSPFGSRDDHRKAYARFLSRRVAASAQFVEEAERARAQLV